MMLFPLIGFLFCCKYKMRLFNAGCQITYLFPLTCKSCRACFIIVGADYLAFSQFGYIFYVLSMPIESTKELCAYGRFLNGKRS